MVSHCFCLAVSPCCFLLCCLTFHSRCFYLAVCSHLVPPVSCCFADEPLLPSHYHCGSLTVWFIVGVFRPEDFPHSAASADSTHAGMNGVVEPTNNANIGLIRDLWLCTGNQSNSALAAYFENGASANCTHSMQGSSDASGELLLV